MEWIFGIDADGLRSNRAFFWFLGKRSIFLHSTGEISYFKKLGTFWFLLPTFVTAEIGIGEDMLLMSSY